MKYLIELSLFILIACSGCSGSRGVDMNPDAKLQLLNFSYAIASKDSAHWGFSWQVDLHNPGYYTQSDNVVVYAMGAYKEIISSGGFSGTRDVGTGETVHISGTMSIDTSSAPDVLELVPRLSSDGPMADWWPQPGVPQPTWLADAPPNIQLLWKEQRSGTTLSPADASLLSDYIESHNTGG